MRCDLSICSLVMLWLALLASGGVLQGCNQAAGGKVIRESSASGMTTGSHLHKAAYNGTLEELTRVLDSGVDINEQNSVGHTPLHLAAARGRVKIVELLLGRGAYINAQNEIGLTPLHMAIKFGQGKTIDLLITRGANPELRGRVFGMFAEQVMALHLAASQNSAMVVTKLILQAQADVDAKSMEMRKTPLHYASSHNCFEAALLLLANRAKVDAQDRQGETPLHYAVRAGAYEVADLLLKMGADVDSANSAGITPLKLAAGQRDGEMAELLQIYSENEVGAP